MLQACQNGAKLACRLAKLGYTNVYIMPQGIAFLSDKIVIKAHDQRFATPWHADAFYWRGTRHKLSVWIALDAIPFGSRQVFREANAALRPCPERPPRQLQNLFGLRGNQLLGLVSELPLTKCLDARPVLSIPMWILAAFDLVVRVRVLLLLLRRFENGPSW